MVSDTTKPRLPQITEAHSTAIRRTTGMDAGEWCACPLPGHDGVASLSLDTLHDELQLVCDCHGEELFGDWGPALHYYALSDVMFSIRSETVLDRENYKVRGRFVWRMLVLEAAGIVQPVPVDLPELAHDANPALHTARALAAKLIGLRLALADCIDSDPLPFPLSERLVSDYCRLKGKGKDEPRKVIDGLIEAGVLTKDGEDRPRRSGWRPAFLYLPVPTEPVRR